MQVKLECIHTFFTALLHILKIDRVVHVTHLQTSTANLWAHSNLPHMRTVVWGTSIVSAKSKDKEYQRSRIKSSKEKQLLAEQESDSDASDNDDDGNEENDSFEGDDD